ncbi:DUF2243 domain-containing protein [Hymenobacter sp. B81]|uniref:DUF2243 domain-containing protein n=1 Tax=Hymenobacter sp. B81 TaxID=3344878 RepID=UPI0037DD7DFF
MTEHEPLNRGPLIAAGLLLGAGLGGFVDGIVLHQILQWHNMLSARLPPDTLVAAKTNMYWDGVFHAAVWVMTAIGLRVLWAAGARRDVPWSGRTFGGSLVLGWGLFNLVEGTIDHMLLELHHVHEYAADPRPWDWGFLGLAGLQLLLGGVLIRGGRADAAPTGTRPGR